MKEDRIEIRANKEVKSILKKAAALQNKTLSAYIIDSVLPNAKVEIRESEILILSKKDQELFFTMLENSPEPNEELKKLLNE